MLKSSYDHGIVRLIKDNVVCTACNVLKLISPVRCLEADITRELWDVNAYATVKAKLQFTVLRGPNSMFC